MSRVPQVSTPRSSKRAPTTPVKQRVTPASTPTKLGASSVAKSRAPLLGKSPAKANGPLNKVASSESEKPVPALSIREAIALKRAEAKKLQTSTSTGTSTLGTLGGSDEIVTPTASDSPGQDADSLGRLSLRQTIERARSTGTINVATRSLPCLPSALFEIHLGITPEPLRSVPDEPPLPPPSSAELESSSRRAGNPSWFEAQDLQVLKAWNNDIVEIQSEISLFGSLKTIDLHSNKIASLPDSFGDLMSLTNLDLSHNNLASLPDNLFSLPVLMILNISHNQFTSIPFNAPFAKNGSVTRRVSSNFFSITIDRATSPLPRLHTLDASHNKITADSIDLRVPSSLGKLDLSANPLDISTSCHKLIQTLAALPKLTELRLENASIGDDAFPASFPDTFPFPILRLLDLGETKVTIDAMKTALKGMKQSLDYNYTTEEPPVGVCRVIVGKKMRKEPWEIELENQHKRQLSRTRDSISSREAVTGTPTPDPRENVAPRPPPPAKAREVVKEAWEIEAEQGLITEGGKRRARAAVASVEQKVLGHGKRPSLGSTKSPTSLSTLPAQSPPLTLASPKYYNEATLTLTLPSSAPPSKIMGHARTFSLVTPALTAVPGRTTDVAVPAPTLPLHVIVSQPFANTLRSLILVNRRMDRCFALPAGSSEETLLPNLEELDLENCNLPDMVAVSRSDPTSDLTAPPRTNEPIITMVTKMFPNLQTLNLSYNALTNASVGAEALSGLILATGVRRGLKHLRLRGNRITELDGLQIVASSFKGHREVPGWKLDELDIRDNEIGKLPPELGLMPLDVFLVDGNTFRVPQRRVWEREGTKGLLSWLRGRIE
ncbi:hypothetical protein AMATHDRAFT_10419 [Amanita thiersii Skay4041]|uniref:Leucine-rich repeat-containing protein 40 n=1 Tax=Amanita thiersii Skay4041 TaxID=703135 RepID=A0A2A9N7T1_9AGAR|nr:hypothetical protein AMATHDRAFT_10419 [Amanita thiersii Skay4041]